jgi:hypothetical protein
MGRGPSKANLQAREWCIQGPEEENPLWYPPQRSFGRRVEEPVRMGLEESAYVQLSRPACCLRVPLKMGENGAHWNDEA